MNNAGLVVAILADNEAIGLMGPNLEVHPGPARAIGVHEQQTARLLLDTCATVDEARETLLAIKDFYQFVPLLYLVADRTGRSFVFEHTLGRNAEYVVEGTGAPQLVTNFELHRHPAGDPAYQAAPTRETEAFWRYRTLAELVSTRGQPFTVEDLQALQAAVSFPRVLQFLRADGTGRGPQDTGSTLGLDVRTLWHCVFDQATLTATYRFYLGDEVTDDGRLEARHSEYLTFTLEDERPDTG